MTSSSRARAWSLSVSISLVLGAICFVTLNHISAMNIIPCTDTWANHLILSLTVVFVLQIFLAPRFLPQHYKLFLALHAAMILLALWLGVYSISPLGYSKGLIPNLSGFRIIRMNRTSLIQNREIVSLPQGSAVGISPLLLDTRSDCTWMSSAGGELDDLSSCDTVYSPPNADFDILRLRIKSSCGLPDSTAQIKVSILP